MKNSCVLKSFTGGISVIMDSEIEFDELLNDIGTKLLLQPVHTLFGRVCKDLAHLHVTCEGVSDLFSNRL